MKLKNYQEDVVLRAIEIALEDQPELLENQDFVNDVAAYVLNRVPPRYVMSERGFVRLAMEHLSEDENSHGLANVIELMMLVNTGLEVVRTRRPPKPKNGNGHVAAVPGTIEYVHNFPQIVGRVQDSSSGEPVVDAVVTFHLDGKPVAPVDDGWENPYRTRLQTRGYFSFWPSPVRSSDERLVSRYTITVDHPDYAPFTLERELVTSGDFGRSETIEGDSILNLASFRLVRR
jgi:competence protein ComFB